VCEKGQRCGLCTAHPPLQQALSIAAIARRKGFNYKCQGSSQHAPPLSEEAQQDGWWVVDHERVKVSWAAAA
jgi:hypothetical protein